MSLAEQSQHWFPASVQVTVLQARGLRIKGKNGTNDAYAVMQVAKEKYSTSVAEKSVAPVWKEEATFDMPPLHHHGNAERSGLRVHVMHRALVGPDKLLGQAAVSLPELQQDKARSKTEWFKLLDKAGKADKDRGEVLLDIQFTRNNITASMFDLSAADKPRSRLRKFKDKVRGKKEEGLSDAASAVVPSFTQVLTDSEEEGEGDVYGDGAADKEEKKKKHKLKSLFSHKSNLQKTMSQSMSLLPEKNSSLSGSQSSGLNAESSEGKKKFKFMLHKSSGSSDTKGSQRPLSIHEHPKTAAEQSNLCINGSHVYTEEAKPRSSRTGSNFSLASSGHGSMEDLQRSVTSTESHRTLKQNSPWTEDEGSSRQQEEQERVEEEEIRREELERIRMEKERVEEERKRRLEQEERVRKEEEEERERVAEEKRLEEEERRRIEEERKRRQEEERVKESGLKGPYSQLTQEELISLVLKQESQLSEKDKKMSELEQYIDNLLVRVIEEKPSILMSLGSLKKDP
ncbi:rab11 family-interacting protein 1-like [Diretmus argenteus]